MLRALWARRRRKTFYFVKIDLRKLQSTLMRSPGAGEQEGIGQERVNEGVYDWLLDHGFHIGPQGWYADAQTLRRLDPSAIISQERVTASPN